MGLLGRFHPDVPGAVCKVIPGDFSMKKILALFAMLAVTMCAGAFAGAYAAEAADTDLLNGEGIEIAFVISDMSEGRNADLIAACAAGAEKLGADFRFCEAAETGGKIKAVEGYVSVGADVIICQITDPGAMQPCIESAQKRGAKFIAYETDAEASDMFFGIDEFALGYSIAENACKWIGDTFAVGETIKVGIANYPDFAFLAVREAGIRAGFAAMCPNAQIVAVQQAGFALEGMEAGEVWARSHPDLNCIVGISDSGVLGICQAFEMAGIDVSGNNEKLGFFGCEADEEAVALIGNDTAFRGTVALDPVGTAENLIQDAVILANGGEVEHDLAFDVILIDRSNCREFQIQIY